MTMKKKLILFFKILIVSNLVAQQAAKIVFEDENGCLRYVADAENNYIPDFSYAGYKNGEVPIPEVSVVKTIAPIAGDNTAHIQAALDEIAAMPMDENGIRGALLLEAGIYEIHSIVTIRESGIVLRGAGDGGDPATNTILQSIGNTPSERDVVRAGNAAGASWTNALPGTRSVVTSDFVPAGSRSLRVAAPELYSEGNNVILHQTSTNAWLASINFGDTDVDAPWSPGEIDIYFNRYITAVDFEESKITLDAPIYDHFDRSLAEVDIHVLNKANIKQNIGIENLRIDIQTAGEFDESHARNAIRLIGVEDCWVTNVTALHFTYAAVDMTVASRVTVQDCQGLQPHSRIEGARRYNFAVGSNTNNVLFENCRATEGRHSFVSNGTSSVSGIVFYNCTSERDYNASEGHRRWSQGLLFDNITFSQPETTNLLGLYNRGSYGTGHGWSAVQSVAWGVRVPLSRRILLQKPPGRQNYAIACQAIVTNTHQFPHPIGYQELTNETPLITSLYAKQLATRLNQGVPPDAPAKLEANIVDGAVMLNWLDIASQETGYRVEISTDGGATFTEVTALPADATSFLHTDIAALSGELLYRVYAVASSCPSPYSNPANVQVTTSVRTVPVPGLRVFPNPVVDTIFLRAESLIYNILVYNALGALVANEQGVETIDTSAWGKGVFYLQIADDQGRTSLVKIVKQ
jgi:hypothetical protein